MQSILANDERNGETQKSLLQPTVWVDEKMDKELLKLAIYYRKISDNDKLFCSSVRLFWESWEKVRFLPWELKLTPLPYLKNKPPLISFMLVTPGVIGLNSSSISGESSSSSSVDVCLKRRRPSKLDMKA